MTLVDGVDTQLVVGDHEAFARSLDIITESHLIGTCRVDVRSDDRVLGGLLSAHYLVTEPVLRPAIRSGRWQYIRRPPVDTRTAVG